MSALSCWFCDKNAISSDHNNKNICHPKVAQPHNIQNICIYLNKYIYTTYFNTRCVCNNSNNKIKNCLVIRRNGTCERKKTRVEILMTSSSRYQLMIFVIAIPKKKSMVWYRSVCRVWYIELELTYLCAHLHTSTHTYYCLVDDRYFLVPRSSPACRDTASSAVD